MASGVRGVCLWWGQDTAFSEAVTGVGTDKTDVFILVSSPGL